ncbi:9793_t:CDS:10 [Entrophospora sp. SA101]|nr:9793_t:CDS:10 [Entrophospora sp. SA101]
MDNHDDHDKNSVDCDANLTSLDSPKSSFPLKSRPITIPSSRSSSPHRYSSNTHIINPTSIDSNTDLISPEENFSLNDTKKTDSSFYQELSIHVEQPVGSMSISPSNRDIVLAARKGLFIIDLENPYEPPRELHHLTRWEVADVQWNPHLARDTWVASTSNQKGLIWNLARPSSSAVEYILHGHNRAISDINWNPFNPDGLATCSVDTFIHLWDLRRPKKPVRSFCAWTAGATQVKFNGKNEYILASSHDRDVMIWDTRFWNIDEPEVCQGSIHTNSPVWRARHTPVGHGILTMPQRSENKLYLWNQCKPNEPVHVFEDHKDVVKEFDKHLRLWPITNEHLKLIGHEKGKLKSPSEKLLKTGHSTFTFRHPPSLLNGQSTSPTLSVTANISTLRVIPGNRMNATTNNTLRPSGASAGGGNIQPDYLGAAAGMCRVERRSLSPLLWMQNVRMVKPSSGVGKTDEDTPPNMHEEIKLVSKKFLNVEFEKLNPQGRSCTISLHGPWSASGVAFIRINISFPPQYPDKFPPNFNIQRTGMISIMNRTHMLQNLNSIALSHVSQKRPCLEACIRYLLGEQPKEVAQDRYGKDDSDDENLLNSTRRSYDKNLVYILGDKDDNNNVPFPMLCGARFSMNGQLICFFSSLRSPDASNQITSITSRNKIDSSMRSRYTYTHPRSFDSWEQYKIISQLPRPVTSFGQYNYDASYEDDENKDNLLPINSLYFKSKNDTLHNALNSTDHVTLFESTKLDKSGPITHIYDLSKFAACNNRPDLEQVWLLAALILTQAIPTTKFIKNSFSSNDNMSLFTGIHHHYNKYSNNNSKRSEIGGDGFESTTTMMMNDGLFRKVNWGFHPLGNKLVKHLFDHFKKIGDIQTLAMLSCVFDEPFPPKVKSSWSFELQSWNSPNSTNGTTSTNTDYFNYHTRYPDKCSPTGYTNRNPIYSGNQSIYGESYNSHKGSWGTVLQTGNSPKQLTSSTTGIYGHSEGSGAYITMPTPNHKPNHHRRSTFGGPTRDGNIFSSSLGAVTASSPPRTPKKDSPAIGGGGGFADNFGWGGMGSGVNHANEKNLDNERKPNEINITMMNYEEFDDERRPIFVPLLDNDRNTKEIHDQYRLAYSEILYHWGLYEERTELLKFMSFVKTNVGSPIGEREEPLEIVTRCYLCEAELKSGTKCTKCRVIGIRCSICHLVVKGLSNFCVKCSHGGHTNHLNEWFLDGNTECPTGCGCICYLQDGGFGFDDRFY